MSKIHDRMGVLMNKRELVVHLPGSINSNDISSTSAPSGIRCTPQMSNENSAEKSIFQFKEKVQTNTLQVSWTGPITFQWEIRNIKQGHLIKQWRRLQRVACVSNTWTLDNTKREAIMQTYWGLSKPVIKGKRKTNTKATYEPLSHCIRFCKNIEMPRAMLTFTIH